MMTKDRQVDYFWHWKEKFGAYFHIDVAVCSILPCRLCGHSFLVHTPQRFHLKNQYSFFVVQTMIFMHLIEILHWRRQFRNVWTLWLSKYLF